jgi:hypothetical protein
MQRGVCSAIWHNTVSAVHEHQGKRCVYLNTEVSFRSSAALLQTVRGTKTKFNTETEIRCVKWSATLNKRYSHRRNSLYRYLATIHSLQYLTIKTTILSSVLPVDKNSFRKLSSYTTLKSPSW